MDEYALLVARALTEFRLFHDDFIWKTLTTNGMLL